MDADVVIRLMKFFETLIHDSLFELETSDEEYQIYELIVMLIQRRSQWELEASLDEADEKTKKLVESEKRRIERELKNGSGDKS